MKYTNWWPTQLVTMSWADTRYQTSWNNAVPKKCISQQSVALAPTEGCQPFSRGLGPIPEEDWERQEWQVESGEIPSVRSSSEVSLSSLSAPLAGLQPSSSSLSSIASFAAGMTLSCWAVCRHLDNGKRITIEDSFELRTCSKWSAGKQWVCRFSHLQCFATYLLICRIILNGSDIMSDHLKAFLSLSHCLPSRDEPPQSAGREGRRLSHRTATRWPKSLFYFTAENKSLLYCITRILPHSHRRWCCSLHTLGAEKTSSWLTSPPPTEMSGFSIFRLRSFKELAAGGWKMTQVALMTSGTSATLNLRDHRGTISQTAHPVGVLSLSYWPCDMNKLACTATGLLHHWEQHTLYLLNQQQSPHRPDHANIKPLKNLLLNSYCRNATKYCHFDLGFD